MSAYVDIETSPEALAEEEELIEAVEALVGVVSTSIWTEIVNEMEEFLAFGREIIYAIFPLLVEYTSGTRSIRTDLQKLAFFFIISMIAVTIFSPNITVCFWKWKMWRRLLPWKNRAERRRSLENQHNRAHSFGLAGSRTTSQQHVLTPDDQQYYYSPDGSGDPSPGHQILWDSSSPQCRHSLQGFDHLDYSNSSNCNNNYYNYTASSSYDWDAPTETDEERFQKTWPTVHASKYRKLLLPPTCRRILTTVAKSKSDFPRNNNTSTPKASSTTTANKIKKTSELEEDNPYVRIQNYILQLLYFIRSILSYDYTRAGWTLITWLQGLQRIHQYRQNRSRFHSTDDILNEESTAVVVSNDVMTMRRVPVQNENGEVVQESGNNETNAEKTIVDSGSTPSEIAENCRSFDDSDLRITDEQITKTHSNFSEADVDDDNDVSDTNEDNDSKLPLHVKPSLGEVITPLRENTTKTNSSSMMMITKKQNSNEGIDLLKGNIHRLHDSRTSGSLLINERSISTNNSEEESTLHNEPVSGGEGIIDQCDARSNNYSGPLHRPEKNVISNNKNKDENGDTNVINKGKTLPVEFANTASGENDPSQHCELNGVTEHHLGNESIQRESMIDFFDAAAEQESIHQQLEALLPDKHGYILSERLLLDSRNDTPLLVFVNSRSGIHQGQILITQLRRLLNPIQVWDLADGGPEDILESFSVFSRLRVMVCGGDGTVAWIISALEKLDVYNNNKNNKHADSKDSKNKDGTGRKLRKMPFRRRQLEHESDRGTQPKIRRQWPPIAILPLGTGNDLARIHGWGGGYNNESLINILEQISESYASLLDRWELTITDAKSKKTETKNFFNYLGVGADAQAALQVHNLRESRPDWFFSRLVNKTMYALFGAEDIIKASNVHTRRNIKLIADGVPIPLPLDSQGIILLNIDAYAGGVPLWSHGTKGEYPNDMLNNKLPPRRIRSLTDVDKGHATYFLSSSTQEKKHASSMHRIDSVEDFENLPLDERYARLTACDLPSSCQDGILEVVSIRGAFHLGQIKVGLSNAQRLCQCREATIIIKNKVAVQIDGEPWRQPTSTLTIKRKKDHAVMLHRSADDGGVEMEMSKLLDWAEERSMIDTQVHSILMKEFSRRIESKNRQRRVRHKDSNIMSTLKKAISSGAMANNLTGNAPQSQRQGGGGLYF